MFPITSLNQVISWEGEAPAEPWSRKLGRSLALPTVFMGSGIPELWSGGLALQNTFNPFDKLTF